MDEFSYQGHEFILRDIIEEFLEVDIHDICISILEVFKQFYDCLLGSSSRSKPIAMLTEMRLDYWRQYLYDCLFNDAVDHCWNSKVSHSTIRLWYLYPSHWLRTVFPISDFFLDGLPILSEIIIDFIHSDSIGSTRTFVGFHLLVRLGHVVFTQDFL